MLENLYSFNRDSRHVQFFNWVWGINPSEKFKTMCPYFWSYFFTILLLPFILLFKLIYSGVTPLGTLLTSAAEKCKEKGKEVNNSKPVATISDTYKAVKTNTWSNRIFTIIASVICLRLLYSFMLFLYSILIEVDWAEVLHFTIIITIAIGFIVTISYLIDKFGVCVGDFMSRSWLIKGIVIICSMIWATYKEFCPIITWEDSENKTL